MMPTDYTLWLIGMMFGCVVWLAVIVMIAYTIASAPCPPSRAGEEEED